MCMLGSFDGGLREDDSQGSFIIFRMRTSELSKIKTLHLIGHSYRLFGLNLCISLVELAKSAGNRETAFLHHSNVHSSIQECSL